MRLFNLCAGLFQFVLALLFINIVVDSYGSFWPFLTSSDPDSMVLFFLWLFAIIHAIAAFARAITE